MGFKNKKVESTLNNLFSGGRQSAPASEPAEPVDPQEDKIEIPSESSVESPGIRHPAAEPARGFPRDAPAGSQKAGEEVIEVAVEPDQQKTAPAEPQVPAKPSLALETGMEAVPAALSAAEPNNSSSAAVQAGMEKPAQKAAAAPSGQRENEAVQKVVVFTLAKEYYAVDIGIVESIIKMQTITEVPHSHAYVIGVTNLRGSVLPVIDLRRRLDLPIEEGNKDNRIVVVGVKEEKIGMLVDAVNEVISIPKADVEPLPALVSSIDTDYVVGVAKVDQRLVTLLDMAKVLGL